MNLDSSFIITSTIIIVSLIPLYIYSKKAFKVYYQKKDISSFLKDIKIYLNETFFNITFNYKILEKTKDVKDSRIKQTLIIEDIISQFNSFEYSTYTQDPLNHDLLWASYESESKPFNQKAPKDLIRRKELAWKRDKEACDRCGQKVKLLEAHLTFAKEIQDGGSYHFENLTILCNDCYRIKNSSSCVKDLHLENILMKKALF